MRLFKLPQLTALTIAASLSQIGEFSFILAGLGVSLEVLPQQGHDLILAGALLSIIANPLMFAGWTAGSDASSPAVAVTQVAGHQLGSPGGHRRPRDRGRLRPGGRENCRGCCRSAACRWC